MMRREAHVMAETTLQPETSTFDDEIRATEAWMTSPRFRGIQRLYSARQVVEQRGTFQGDSTIARTAAEAFYARLRELFDRRESITTFGPYSPGQAVMMKRMGIEGIYLGGWATSAKGSFDEDPGPDLASYPLSQVPNEASTLVRALLAADRNQRYQRARMGEAERKAHPPIDYRPFLIADADTGHGGESHVRNLIRRFVEVGVPGYHIEDQKPGVKKCGHQAGKVLVAQDEQIKRLVAARFQLDVMGVPGIIVARTDAEAATFIDSRGDERDQSFLLGATNVNVPSCKVASLAVMKRFYDRGVPEINGHFLYRISEGAYEDAFDWMKKTGVLSLVDERIAAVRAGKESSDTAFDRVMDKFLDVWQMDAGLKTYGEAVADVMRFQIEDGASFDLTPGEWVKWAETVSLVEAREKARSMGIQIFWDWELPKTPEGYYQIQGGIHYAIHRSLAVAPFADILWMETKTADLHDAKEFAEAIHAVFPDKMLAYNLSPSFNWDTTGMTEQQMKEFPAELGKLGFVFNFITYGGHQIDGLAAEEFATALKQDGMLALARLQRKLRLLDSPYKTPQTHVGGPRIDGALMACTGRTATTKAMGKGSTQFQHLVQTEVPPKLLEEWLALWAKEHGIDRRLRVSLRPHTAGSELLELKVLDDSGKKVADVIFATIQDRRGRTFLSVRDQNNFDEALRRKRLMTLLHLFLIHRYKAFTVHFVSPSEDTIPQTMRMKDRGIFDEVTSEVGHITVAHVSSERIKELLNPDQEALKALIEGR
jgi:isocitrate lyase